MKLPRGKTAQNTINRIKGRIERYTAELAYLEKEGNANCARAHELRGWIHQDEKELKSYIK